MRKLTRRDFNIITGTALAGSFVLPKISSGASLKEVGIQVYTLRENIAIDVPGTLKAVANAGYTYVEGYSTDKGLFFGYQPTEFKKLLSDLGLKMVSTHMGVPKNEADKDNHKRALASLKEVGLNYVTLPWIEQEYTTSIDNIKKLCGLLNDSAILAKSAGLIQCYHNHDFEFNEVEGEVVYDVMLKETDASLVKFELDIYWITKAEKNPFDYFSKNPGRFPLWHVKDMDKTDRNLNTEVGNGTINWKSLFQKSSLCGLKYPFVEQENNYKPDFIGSVKASADYLKKMSY